MTSRADVLKTMTAFARTLRGGSYFVWRGAYDWNAHDFDAKPLGMSIVHDEGDIRLSPQVGGRSGSFSIEAFTQMPDQADAGIDDDELDGVLDDVERLVRNLIQSRNASGDPIILGLVSDAGGRPRFVEVHDANRRVQGIVARFGATY